MGETTTRVSLGGFKYQFQSATEMKQMNSDICLHPNGEAANALAGLKRQEH